jgi:hypothetical protein
MLGKNRMTTLAKYAAVFGRSPASVRPAENGGQISAAMFPPLKRSFWRGLMSEAHDVTVAITYGLSDHAMPVPPTELRETSDRIELIAFSAVPIGGGPSGREDMASAVLQMIGDYIVDQKLVVGVGHTLDFRQPLGTNVEMSAVLFALPFGIDVKRVMRCSRARELLNIVPITPAELHLAREKDIGALLDRFEATGVEAAFDCFRKSAV